MSDRRRGKLIAIIDGDDPGLCFVGFGRHELDLRERLQICHPGKLLVAFWHECTLSEFNEWQHRNKLHWSHGYWYRKQSLARLKRETRHYGC